MLSNFWGGLENLDTKIKFRIGWRHRLVSGLLPSKNYFLTIAVNWSVYNMRNIFLKNHSQNVEEKLALDSFALILIAVRITVFFFCHDPLTPWHLWWSLRLLATRLVYYSCPIKILDHYPPRIYKDKRNGILKYRLYTTL